jgi:hypothetical protein
MGRILSIVMLFVLLGIGAYFYMSYLFVYSEGYREGLLNKFSTKGTLFKTHEGELLMPGTIPNMQQLSSNYFYFSSQKPAVVEKLNQLTGHKIKLHYVQYKSALPWRGDDYSQQNKEEGQYMVDEVVEVK